jgi:hypothetical protein
MSDMRRREFIALSAGQQQRGRSRCARNSPSGCTRVGVLMNGTLTETAPQSYVAAFVQALRQLGWTEDQNLRIDMPPDSCASRRHS